MYERCRYQGIQIQYLEEEHIRRTLDPYYCGDNTRGGIHYEDEKEIYAKQVQEFYTRQL